MLTGNSIGPLRRIVKEIDLVRQKTMNFVTVCILPVTLSQLTGYNYALLDTSNV